MKSLSEIGPAQFQGMNITYTVSRSSVTCRVIIHCPLIRCALSDKVG